MIILMKTLQGYLSLRGKKFQSEPKIRSFPWLIPHKCLLKFIIDDRGLILGITSLYLKILLGNLQVVYSCGRLLLPYGTLEESFSTFHVQWGFGGSFKKIVFKILGGPVMKPSSTFLLSIRVKALLAEIWFKRSQRVFYKKNLLRGSFVMKLQDLMHPPALFPSCFLVFQCKRTI